MSDFEWRVKINILFEMYIQFFFKLLGTGSCNLIGNLRSFSLQPTCRYSCRVRLEGDLRGVFCEGLLMPVHLQGCHLCYDGGICHQLCVPLSCA